MSGGLVITEAREEDLEQLLNLYFSIYGNDYPLKIGLERNATQQALADHQNYYWLVAKVTDGTIVGSCLFELDWKYKIGKVSGVVVHRDHQGKGISGRLVREGSDKILNQQVGINTLYTTTRTLSVVPQLMFLNNGYIPLGIFPNAHKIKEYETLTLMGAFRRGVLRKRAKVESVPPEVLPILDIVNELLTQ
ncbi:MAG: GNAT family N-acetyltransferase, partial [Oligoflexia bacterium]|nr:GNAT family N-acetyltransferase [Oligoflexia bacterium]